MFRLKCFLILIAALGFTAAANAGGSQGQPPATPPSIPAAA